MDQGAIGAIAGAAIAFGARELWNYFKTSAFERISRREKLIEERERKLHEVDVRFATLEGRLHGWEFRMEVTHTRLAEMEKQKADLNAAWARIRALEGVTPRASDGRAAERREFSPPVEASADARD